MNARKNLLVGTVIGLLVGIMPMYSGQQSLGQNRPRFGEKKAIVSTPNPFAAEVEPRQAAGAIVAMPWKYYCIDSKVSGLIVLDTTTGELWQRSGEGWHSMGMPPRPHL